MEKTELKKEPDGKLTLFTMGLRLEVQPYWLIKQMINKNSQDILDKIIEDEFLSALDEFDKWQKKVLEAIGEDDDPDVEFVKYRRDVHVQQIQNVADMSRHLLPLHSDWEAVVGEDEAEIIERAYEYWRYNDFYGYEKLV
jgi:hypothetical protein